MKNNYIIVGDNNYWYATTPKITEKQAIKTVRRIKKEIKKGIYENNDAIDLYLFRAQEITYIE